MTDTKPKTRKQMVESARLAAMAGDWQLAIEINRDILTRSPRDANAYNRIGRALIEQRQFASALEAYTAVMKIDPANMIARRNLHRLDLLRKSHSADEAVVGGVESKAFTPRTTVFIEEVGKTWVDELVNPAPKELLADVSSAEQLSVRVADGRLIVVRENGERLGEIEAKTAERIIGLIQGGNRYEIYALGLSSLSMRVILREVYRHPDQAGKVSFPRQISQTRAYMRDRDLLRQRDEADFFSTDDDDELDEEESRPVAADDEEGQEPDAFEEEPVTVEESDPRI